MSTVRQRFTLMYAALFLLSGAGLLTLTNLLSLSDVTPAQPGPAPVPSTLAAARQRITQLETQLAATQTDQAHQLLIGSAIALAVMAAFSLVLGRIVAGRVLRPLRTITSATRRISADNLHERLAVPGPADEVKSLADTIDQLLERLEGSFAAQRRFVANASHELRTPLATMRAWLDVTVAAPEPVPAPTIELTSRLRTELDQIDRLLEGFLTLARAQHGALSDRAPCSLGALASACLQARAGDLSAKRLTVHHDDAHDRAHDGAWTRGNHTLLARMVDNVIDNAITHNHDDGWIRLTATAEHTTALLVVESGGHVLHHDQLVRLAQPFHKLGTERTGPGLGLGLSIVAAIASAHGGTLDLRARPEGGLHVALHLPLEPPPSLRPAPVAGPAPLPGPAPVAGPAPVSGSARRGGGA